jgi:hypothetical protein
MRRGCKGPPTRAREGIRTPDRPLTRRLLYL